MKQLAILAILFTPIKVQKPKNIEVEVEFRVEKKLQTFNHDIQDLIYQIEAR